MCRDAAVCRGVPRCVGARRGAPGCAEMRRGAARCVGVRRGAAGCVGVCRGAAGCAGVCRGAARCAEMCRDVPGRGGTRRDTAGCGVCRDVPGCAGMRRVSCGLQRGLRHALNAVARCVVERHGWAIANRGIRRGRPGLRGQSAVVYRSKRSALTLVTWFSGAIHAQAPIVQQAVDVDAGDVVPDSSRVLSRRRHTSSMCASFARPRCSHERRQPTR